MTQALLNKLSISIEKTVNLADKMPKTEGLDFGKLFESKTNNYNKQSESDYNTKTTDSKISNKNSNEYKNTKKDSTEEKTTNNIKSDDTNKQNIQQNNTQKKTENVTVSDTDANVKTDKTTDTDNTEKTITDDEINTIDENTITEEEPTMYNELNTLEDPTTMLLLQTQIQKNISKCLENDLSEDLNEETVNLKTNDSILNNATLFKQLDNAASKDINVNINQFTQLSPKEMAQSKSANTKISNVINENIVKELNVEVISSQSAEAETSFGDLMQNQSPQEQAARVMIQGDVKYEAVAAKSAQNIQVKPTVITPSKIIEQITKQLDGMVNNSKLNMVLNPGTLGKVNVQLLNTKDGLMAQFTVTTQDVKDILMKGLDGLKESLLAQGVNVDNVSVKLEETESEYKQDYTEQEGSKGGNKQQNSKNNHKENEKTFEELIGANVEEKSET